MRDIAYIWADEVKRIFRDAGVMIYLFLLPFGYPLLYALIYNPQTLRSLPVVVIDNDHSHMSREYCRMLDATPGVTIISYAANEEEAKALMGNKKAHGIITINRDFQSDIYSGKQTHINAVTDMNSLLYYRIILTATSDVTSALNDIIFEKGLFKNSYSTSMEEQAVVSPDKRVINISVSPMTNYQESLYNPVSGFATFIMPGIEIIVVQQALFLAIGMMAGTARDKNRNNHIFPHRDMHYKDIFKVIVGKGLIFFTLGIIALFWTLICVPRIFNFPQLGSLFDIMMFITPYLLACIFLGMTLSCIIKGREEPLLFYVFVSVPLLFLSGMTWPWCSIPPYMKYPGCLVPSTFAIQGFIQMGSCGATLANIRFYYLFEWALAGFYFVTAMIVYRRQMKLSEIYA